MGKLNVNKVIGSVCVSGFMIGILYINLFVSDYIRISGVFSETYIHSFTNAEFIITDILGELLWRRGLPILLLVIFARTKYNRLLSLIILLWYSFIFGSFLSMGIITHGGKGLVLCIMSIIPHMFLYLLGYYLIFVYVFYLPNIRWNYMKSITLLLSILCGIVLECNINPIILKWYIGFM